MLKGITITGDYTFLKSTNFSINIALNTVLNPDWKKLSVSLTIEIYHLVIWILAVSHIKNYECYNANDIVFCSGSSSTIKRGYWFGNITEKPTILHSVQSIIVTLLVVRLLMDIIIFRK